MFVDVINYSNSFFLFSTCSFHLNSILYTYTLYRYIICYIREKEKTNKNNVVNGTENLILIQYRKQFLSFFPKLSSFTHSKIGNQIKSIIVGCLVQNSCIRTLLFFFLHIRRTDKLIFWITD